MTELVSLDRVGPVAIITINNPPVNALSPGVPEGIVDQNRAAQADDEVSAVVLIGGGRTFIAGADINEFAKMTSGERQGGVGLYPVLLELENSSKPVVCAIHGTALGGGLEVAQACHYRVATRDAQLGQPEVKLGLIPGAAGTQRLPRLIGVAKALEMCAQGDPISAVEGYRLGLLDRLVDGDLRAAAVAFAREIAGTEPPRTRDRKDKLGDAAEQQAIFAAAREMASSRARGLIAPLRAIDAVEAATRLDFEAGCQREAELFEECLFSEQSKALIHVFFGERAVGKIPGLPRHTPRLEIRRAAVVGAGTMGGAIAMVYANAGIPVVLKEVESAALERGMKIIRDNYERTMQKGRMTQAEVDERLELIQPTLEYDDFSDVDIVVEAAFENLDLKKEIFGRLDELCRDDVILASNTSSLDIDQMAAATSRPEQVIGHHFFSPANVMRLLEIVRGRRTSDSVIATSMALAKRLKKVGVLVGNCRGFVGNRMIAPYSREAQFLVEEGAAPQDVDLALQSFGMAMGPLAMADLAGIDVGWRVRQEAKDEVANNERRPLIADRLYELGRYGQKTGAGWYRYEEGNRRPIPDPAVDALIEEVVSGDGRDRRQISDKEIVERTLYALVNEGAFILEEGIAQRAVDIDIIYVYGYGFPAARGGPMWYASTVGLDRVLARIEEFHIQQGEAWRPAPLLERLAKEGRTFDDFDREQRAKP